MLSNLAARFLLTCADRATARAGVPNAQRTVATVLKHLADPDVRDCDLTDAILDTVLDAGFTWPGLVLEPITRPAWWAGAARALNQVAEAAVNRTELPNPYAAMHCILETLESCDSSGDLIYRVQGDLATLGFEWADPDEYDDAA